MAYTVYLSSTLNDLEPERRAVQEALADQCVVKHSYEASDDPVVESCLADVAACDLYIGILGLRYGHVPSRGFENPELLSITELEYRHAVACHIPRHVFVKSEDVIPVTLTDYRTKEHPPERIEAFRQTAAGDQRAAQFQSLHELREHVIKAFNAFKEKHERQATERVPRFPQRAANEANRLAYLTWLRQDCEKVILLGLDLRDRQNVRLGQVYVPALTGVILEAATVGGSAADSPVYTFLNFATPKLLFHHLGVNSLYVPGPPGSGKSTFCRWVALAAASGELPANLAGLPEEFTEQMPEALRGRFPLLVPLRQWASDSRWLGGNGQWSRQQLEDALAAWIDAAHPGGLTSSSFLEVLHRGSCLLILDGVDEVPEQLSGQYGRSNLLTGLADAIPQWTSLGNRILLTSRPYGVEDAEVRSLGLVQAELSPLPRALERVFVHRWYAAAAGGGGDSEKGDGLIAHLDGRPDLSGLRRNPMLLTALCVKYDEDLRLPGDLHRLYSSVTDQVLYKRFHTEPERDLARLRLAAVALAMHTGPARDPRTTPGAEVPYDEVDDALTDLARTDPTSEQGSREASERREMLLSNSGLLISRPNRRAGFYHLSFQEFLAAERLRRLGHDVSTIVAERMGEPEWRRTLRFLFCTIADQTRPERAFAEFRVLLSKLQHDDLSRNPNPALLLAECLEVGHARGWSLQAFAQPFRQACDYALTAVESPLRADLWRLLGQMGLDNRGGVGVRDGVPDISWVEVPTAPLAPSEERVIVTLPSYQIARYPTTNAQFDAFVQDRGYETKDGWREGERRSRRSAVSVATQPCHATWSEAMGFCVWLEARLRNLGALTGEKRIRLPTEQEWERAARAGDGRAQRFRGSYNMNDTNMVYRALEFIDTANFLAALSAPVGMNRRGPSSLCVDDMTDGLEHWCLSSVATRAQADGEGVVKLGVPDRDRTEVTLFHREGPGIKSAHGFRVVCAESNR